VSGTLGVGAAMGRTRARKASLPVALLGAILLAGCAAAPDAGQAQTDPCDFGAIVFDVGPAICSDAVALAEARLGWLHWPVASTRFRPDVCPPFARCPANLGNEGWVIFTFSIGEPSMIHVGPPDPTLGIGAALVAGEPQPLPDWLRDELRQEVPLPQQP
jgi:hypothetical protein